MSKQFYLPMRDANDPHKVTLIPVSEDVYANITPEPPPVSWTVLLPEAVPLEM